MIRNIALHLVIKRRTKTHTHVYEALINEINTIGYMQCCQAHNLKVAGSTGGNARRAVNPAPAINPKDYNLFKLL